MLFPSSQEMQTLAWHHLNWSQFVAHSVSFVYFWVDHEFRINVDKSSKMIFWGNFWPLFEIGDTLGIIRNSPLSPSFSNKPFHSKHWSLRPTSHMFVKDIKFLKEVSGWKIQIIGIKNIFWNVTLSSVKYF